MAKSIETSFISDFFTYINRMREFDAKDWIVYILWIGLMFGLLAVTSIFVTYGHIVGAPFPGYAWNVPVGVFIFVTAIAIDTIGHRTIYKEELKKGEALVHHITIFAGITSCLLLSLGYHFPEGLKFPALVMVFLSVFYSIVDEAFHWRRYLQGHSDRVEMWSHFFIFVGHLLMILSWTQWFLDGYPGVSQFLEVTLH